MTILTRMNAKVVMVIVILMSPNSRVKIYKELSSLVGCAAFLARLLLLTNFELSLLVCSSFFVIYVTMLCGCGLFMIYSFFAIISFSLRGRGSVEYYNITILVYSNLASCIATVQSWFVILIKSICLGLWFILIVKRDSHCVVIASNHAFDVTLTR